MMKRKISVFIMVTVISSLIFSFAALGAEIIAEGVCGKDAKWTLDSDGVAYISGSGSISNDEDNPWWGSYGDKIRHVYVDKGITMAGRWSFAKLPNLETAEFAEGFQHLGMNAFYFCEKLKEVRFPESLFIVDTSAFDNAYELSALYFKGELPAGIYGYLFNGNNYNLAVYSSKKHYDSYKNSMLEYFIRNNREYVDTTQSVQVFTTGLSAKINDSFETLNDKKEEFALSVSSPYDGISVEWFSSDPLVATVDETGLVKRGAKHGSTIIYALISKGEERGVVTSIIRNNRNDLLVSLLPTEGHKLSFPASYTIRMYDDLHGANEKSAPDIFAETDLTKSEYVEILEKTKEITADCKTDYEKAKAICRWIYGYMEYDGSLAIGRTIKQIYKVYKTRESHCQGFAYLTGLMLYQSGIINATVTSISHMWNIALIDGRWVQLDSTAGIFDYEYNEADFIDNIIFASDNRTYILSGMEGVKFAGLGCEFMPDEETEVLEISPMAKVILDCALDNAPAVKKVIIPSTVEKILGTPFIEKDREFNITYKGTEEDWMNMEFSQHSQKKATVNIDGKTVSFKERIENKPVEVIINGKIVEGDVPSQIIANRTMVPIRVIAEYLGADVLWDDSERNVTVKRDGNTVILKIGSKVIEKNGEKFRIDASPVITNGRTLVPVRAIADALGADVSWDTEGRYAIITDYTLLGKI